MFLNRDITALISSLGGTGEVARHLNINPSAISNWKKLNKVPKNKQDSLFNLSKNLNVNIEKFLKSKIIIKKNIEKKINVLLIICGGIAAYKSMELIRLIKKTEIELDVVITKSAQKFITPLLITSLNGRKCYTELFSPEDESKMNHINLARKPDIILISPATANIMAKFACGIADDLASTILLASSSKIIMAPSMNPVMWRNLATIENYKKLIDRGVYFIDPEKGDMACGESGTGRLADINVIFENLIDHINSLHYQNRNLKNVSVIVTAGPTIEDIDPVRFISNKSSGKQGFAIASELEKRGANVTLITGPVNIPFPKVTKIINIKSAQEMFEKTIAELPSTVIICTAAVADWKLVPKSEILPSYNTNNKIKKTGNIKKKLLFEAIENPDILSSVSQNKSRPKLVIGFAAETDDIVRFAKQKLISKKLDLIIANDVSKDQVFGDDNNKVFLIDQNNSEE